MRIWHKELLYALPDKKVVEQWRDCGTIARNIDMIGTPNHYLVNRVMDFPLSHLYTYSMNVIDEMKRRGFAVSTPSFINFEKHIFSAMSKCNDVQDFVDDQVIFYTWHNDTYLWQCATILEEEHDCGAINDEEWDRIEDTCRMFAYPWE